MKSKSHHSVLSMTVFAPLTPRPEGYKEPHYLELKED